MANEAHVTKQGPGDDEDGAHRLRDIVVEEVSLVDRAANKRRFLVVKRSGDMADEKPEGEKDEREAAGGRRDKSKKKAKPKAEETEAEKARRAAAPDEEDETEKARRRAPAEDEEADAEKTKGDDEEDEDEVEKARAKPKPKTDEDVDTAEKADDDEEDEDDDDDELALPAAAKNAILGVLTQALERLMAVANQVKAADAPDDGDAPTVPDDLGEELEEIGELLEDVGERFEGVTEKRAVRKAGARMAKDRLDRFQKALALLSEVLKELTDAKKPKDPTAGGAQAKVDKRDAAPGIADLVASIGELTRVVKHQEEELARIRKTRGVSNAIPVDGGGRRGEPQEVSWPLDMNRPISRDSVAKAVSFYDE